ncbi:arylesterase [Caenimonas aquaedulcis]|uniref:Arylesterase n=1 Tax=Caenimonas aquaedulcis TaxID=2793270 RepID=A0A931H1J0_9BURK|nr:arylesterase [Caenimonas aquaedulcis]MBG9386833.1 arylesterase [Caenimonas aquaedulcis]
MLDGFWSRRHFIAAALAAAYARAGAAGPTSIVVVGDSLSAEYGLKRGTGWVALLQKRLAAEKAAVEVVNASISGDTTSGGRSRLPALLAQHHPGVVILELGANDALRGLPLAMTQENLTQMVVASQKAGAKVLVIGQQVPPNYGGDYSARFAAMFDSVAKAHKAALVPFMLKGVADGADPLKLFQADRIHPKEEAHPQILDNIWPELRKLLALRPAKAAA